MATEHLFVTDLKFGRTSEVAVEILLRNGEKILSGVKDLDDEHNLVKLHDSKTLGRDKTACRLNIGDIVTPSVTRIEYRIK